jgi:hypothetical protein
MLGLTITVAVAVAVGDSLGFSLAICLRFYDRNNSTTSYA